MDNMAGGKPKIDYGTAKRFLLNTLGIFFIVIATLSVSALIALIAGGAIHPVVFIAVLIVVRRRARKNKIYNAVFKSRR